jgi:pimeloyl-ACP methyl ester carboxylesterase
MTKRTILFLHGFASSARTTKAQYLDQRLSKFSDVMFRAIDFCPTPKDFEYMTTTGMINRLRQYVHDHALEKVSIIGSSYGGLIAMHYAHRFCGIERMLLLAPVLHRLSGEPNHKELIQWRETGVATVFHFAFGKDLPLRYDFEADGFGYAEFVPPAIPTLIIHGQRDTSVPVEDSRQYALRYPDKVQLIEVDADHDLNSHLPLIWEHVQSFLLDVSSPMWGIGETQGVA